MSFYSHIQYPYGQGAGRTDPKEREYYLGDLRSPMVRHMLGHWSGHMVSIQSLCARSEERDEVSLYSIAALILKHEGKTSEVLI